MSAWLVTVDKWGRSQVTVDGNEIEGVAGIAVASVPGQPPALTLYPEHDITISGEGIVQVVDQDSTRQTVLEFLRTLDPKTFEQSILDSLGGFGGPASTGEAAIAALRLEAETLP